MPRNAGQAWPIEDPALAGKDQVFQGKIKMQNDTPYLKELPDKLYFKVGEVSSIVGVPAYVLRFWESEFNKINPKRTSAGQRLYRKKDVELILWIKHLLYEKKFTIEGAKQRLKTQPSGQREKPPTDILQEICTELQKIRDLLT
jgi:DNA-binding transcriptional MerR regulator